MSDFEINTPPNKSKGVIIPESTPNPSDEKALDSEKPKLESVKTAPAQVQASEGEVIAAVVKLLSPFADADSIHLKEDRFKFNNYQSTGIIVTRNYKGVVGHIEFKFFMDDPERGKDLHIGFLFRMIDFLKEPEGYITGMLHNLGLSMHAYATWREANMFRFNADGEGGKPRE